MSKLFPEYSVAIDDIRFPQVYSKWCIDIMSVMFNQAPSLDFIDRIEFWIGTHNKPLGQALRSDFKKMVSKYQHSPTEHVILAYGHNTFSLEQIYTEIRQLMAQKRSNNFEIMVTTAFNLTNTIDNRLLDDPLPAINLVLINFTGAKDFLAIHPATR